jgi:hypothetical protein
MLSKDLGSYSTLTIIKETKMLSGKQIKLNTYFLFFLNPANVFRTMKKNIISNSKGKSIKDKNKKYSRKVWNIQKNTKMLEPK